MDNDRASQRSWEPYSDFEARRCSGSSMRMLFGIVLIIQRHRIVCGELRRAAVRFGDSAAVSKNACWLRTASDRAPQSHEGTIDLIANPITTDSQAECTRLNPSFGEAVQLLRRV